MNHDKDILIVEDEVALADVLREYLEAAGYEVRVMNEGTGVVESVREKEPSLIVLDLMLPGRDGMDICREVRGFSPVPIIMATARVEEIDRLLGLELGADDYVCKPYSPREVVARIKAIFRRIEALTARAEPKENTQELILDEYCFEARFKGDSLALTPAEFRLIKTLHNHPGRIFSRAKLIDSLYDDGRVVTDRTVDTHVKNLRKKLAGHFNGEQFIRSVYGVGYKYELEAD